MALGDHGGWKSHRVHGAVDQRALRCSFNFFLNKALLLSNADGDAPPAVITLSIGPTSLIWRCVPHTATKPLPHPVSFQQCFGLCFCKSTPTRTATNDVWKFDTSKQPHEDQWTPVEWLPQEVVKAGGESGDDGCFKRPPP